jgi:glutathione-regulated potassium-efflux system ancillary protein KefF
VITLIYAHPHPRQSRAGAALLGAVRDLPGLAVRSLYDMYPDFAIDVAAEQAALDASRLLIWQHPVHWYGPPALLKLWFEQVLAAGWAYEGGRALAGKDCLWVCSTGGPFEAYAPEQEHGHEFAAFAPAMRQTARYCGMHWLDPLVVHGAARAGEASLAEAAQTYRTRLQAWIAEHGH